VRFSAFAAALIATGLLTAGCGVPGADGPADSFGLDLTMPAHAPADGAVIFVVDGVSAKVFGQMLAAGELPAIRRYFVERGLYCPGAVVNTPSVTLANLTSITTGQFPGHHGITGINWFDRNRLIWRNYETIAQKNTVAGDYTAKTIYEYFPDRTTFSVFLQLHRGATKFVENRLSAAPQFGFGWYEFVDRLTLSRLGIVADVARARGRWPAVTFVYLLAPDFRAYAHGVSSPQYRQALRHTDRQIGRVLGDFQRAGLLEKLLIALVSDHGMVDVTQHFPLETYLREQVGLDVATKRLWEDTPFEKRLAAYRKHSAVLYGSGDRYAAICLRKPMRDGEGNLVGFAPWPVRPSAEDLANYPLVAPKDLPAEAAMRVEVASVDLPARLTEAAAVDAIAYAAGPNRVRVRRRTGEVEFRQPAGRGGPVSYHVVSGSDPLGWDARLPKAARTGKPVSPRRWLELTHATQFPDLPAQIVAYFRARRAGDIAVFAAPGWDLSRSLRAGHGGLRPGDMLTPMLLAGPGVPKGKTIAAARTVDLAPTVLEWLGRPAPAGATDGQSLVPGR